MDLIVQFLIKKVFISIDNLFLLSFGFFFGIGVSVIVILVNKSNTCLLIAIFLLIIHLGIYLLTALINPGLASAKNSLSEKYIEENFEKELINSSFFINFLKKNYL